jgi:hypothetical protein
MKGIARLAACIGLLASAAAPAAEPVIRYSEPLQRLEISSVVPGAVPGTTKPGLAEPARMSFDAFGRTFELDLEPNHRLLSDEARASLTGEFGIYRGAVAGAPGSWARIVIANGVPRGLVAIGSDFYAIEPGAAGGAVMYRLEDLYVPPGSVSCDAVEAPSGAAFYGKIAGELTAAAAKPGAVAQISIAAYGDFPLYDRQGEDAEPGLAARLNNVDGIFSEQVGVEIHVASLHVYRSTAADPYNDTRDPRRLLDDVADHRKRSDWQRAQGLTHLFTGRDLEGSTVGIAYNASLCEAEWGAGLTQVGNNPTFDSLVAAHELGHNFGAPHDGETGSACAAVGPGFLMSPTINGSDQFSSCSLAQIDRELAGAFCVVSLPTVDAALAFPNGVPAVVEGESVSVALNVANDGTAEASGVRVDITLPVNAEFGSATAASGTCTDGAGTVSCTISAVPAGAARRITLELTGAEQGSAEITATAFVDGDVDPSNDTVTAQFRVEAAGGTAPPPPPATPAGANDSGGGGSPEPFWLFLLAFGAAWRRFRQAAPAAAPVAVRAAVPVAVPAVAPVVARAHRAPVDGTRAARV